MKRLLIGIASVICLVCIAPSCAASDYFYYGVHYEANGTLGNRFSLMSRSMNFYWISDCYIMPGMVAGFAGWLPNTDNSPAGSQMKWFGTRLGGAQLAVKMGELSVGLEANMDFYNLGIQKANDSQGNSVLKNETTLGLGGGVHALLFGGDAMTFLGIVSCQYVSDRKYPDGQKTSYRLGADLYADIFVMPKVVVYGNIGYGFFPNGIGESYPQNKGFGGMTFNLGIALP